MPGSLIILEILCSTDADKLTIQLPTISQKWGFVNYWFYRTLSLTNAERLATLNAYFETYNLQDYTLTDDEQRLDALDTVTWGEFKIEDVLVWQKSII